MIRSAEEFIQLREENDPRATHDRALKKVWEEIIRIYPDVKEWVAHNKTVPISILRVLASDPDPVVRFTVAMKRKCDEGTFRRLASDVDENVRARVARNPKTPASILELLRKDTSSIVVLALKCRE